MSTAAKLPPKKDRPALLALLAEVTKAVEELSLTGLTAASNTTKQTLAISFQNASKMRLLRLGATLRVASEEIGRFTNSDPLFSRKRYAFFLNRSWMLANGLTRALNKEDEEQWAKLTSQSAPSPLQWIKVLALGVVKKVAPGAFCVFEFRLWVTDCSDEQYIGRRLVWACVFPLRGDTEISAEVHLQLKQKQGFVPSHFLKGYRMKMENVVLAENRITLTDDTKVSEGAPYDQWQKLPEWDWTGCIERIQNYELNPFDLEVEMQEDVLLHDWSVGEPIENDRERLLEYPIEAGPFSMLAQVGLDDENETLREQLNKMRNMRKKKPLFGVVHFEGCRMMLTPLSLIDEDTGPTPINLSNKSVGAAELLKTMKF